MDQPLLPAHAALPCTSTLLQAGYLLTYNIIIAIVLYAFCSKVPIPWKPLYCLKLLNIYYLDSCSKILFVFARNAGSRRIQSGRSRTEFSKSLLLFPFPMSKYTNCGENKDIEPRNNRRASIARCYFSQ
jgi:hypothetical protein